MLIDLLIDSLTDLLICSQLKVSELVGQSEVSSSSVSQAVRQSKDDMMSVS